jgi:DNA-binding response OmpR family regulator
MTPGHLLVIDDSPTVLKVIEIALAEAGYRVLAAADDEAGLALVRESRTVPDLILLDGAIPNRDAVEICRRFAADASLAHVPVVLMAARGEGDDLEGRFAKAPNLVDTISKPFSPEALQALVSHVVRGRTPDDGGPGGPPEIAGPAMTVVREAVEEALSQSADSSTVAEARAFAAFGQALAGDLQGFGVSEILELLASESRSGILRVVNPEMNARIELYFRAGRIDFAAAVGVAEELLFGRFLVGGGDLTAEQLQEVLAARARATGSQPPFGADLVERGLIDADARLRAMTRQTSELAYETLRWQTGFFQFRLTDKLPPLAREASLQLNVDRMLLEGYRRVDEWRVIEREIASFDDVFVRDDDKIGEVPRGTFTRDELAVLGEVDGRQSLRDIVRKLRMGSFDVSKIVFRLRRARLVRRRVAPAASGG